MHYIFFSHLRADQMCHTVEDPFQALINESHHAHYIILPHDIAFACVPYVQEKIVCPVLTCTTGSAWIAFCGKLRDFFYSNRVRYHLLLHQQPVAFNTSGQCQQVSEDHLTFRVYQTCRTISLQQEPLA